MHPAKKRARCKCRKLVATRFMALLDWQPLELSRLQWAVESWRVMLWGVVAAAVAIGAAAMTYLVLYLVITDELTQVLCVKKMFVCGCCLDCVSPSVHIQQPMGPRNYCCSSVLAYLSDDDALFGCLIVTGHKMPHYSDEHPSFL